MKVLSIDAWRDESSWQWNNWYTVGEFPTEYINKSNRFILKWMRDNDFLAESSKGKVTIEDDGYNITIIDRKNYRPLFAIEYGATL